VGAEDKASNKIEDLGGKAKEGLGKAMGDSKLEAEGKMDKAAGKIQNAVGGLKDSLRGKRD